MHPSTRSRSAHLSTAAIWLGLTGGAVILLVWPSSAIPSAWSPAWSLARIAMMVWLPGRLVVASLPVGLPIGSLGRAGLSWVLGLAILVGVALTLNALGWLSLPGALPLSLVVIWGLLWLGVLIAQLRHTQAAPLLQPAGPAGSRLDAVLVGIVVLAVGVFGFWAWQDRSGAPTAERFTEFAAVPLVDSDPAALWVAVQVTNHERQTQDYTVFLVTDSGFTQEIAVGELTDNATWTRDVALPAADRANARRLTLELWMGTDLQPHRTLQLWLEPHP